ncbi:hypothetical protein Talka_01663 [Tepidimonas alkaliphilus]|uniref:DUF2069 domain-containing protein n=1 Tax=Tepidimonas alkaliphilus TaxID=2588942 RepID=A0A554W6P2_9BURK|nr:DUF2069 domain-containing protein [Tepidimonas alkaliphilus]TSE19239.1 hypothetical protein Talka_01663 [Tepidimonas alkaliphilus]
MIERAVPAPAEAARAAPDAAVRAAAGRTRAVAVAALLALIALGLAWELWLAPLRPGGSWWALKVLPLTLPLAGLLKQRLYTYRWMSLLVWPYVAEGLVRGLNEAGLSAALAWGQTALCMLLFAASAAHVRLRLRAARARQAAPAAEPFEGGAP